MITRDQAERIAAEMTGTAPGSPESGWELQEFSVGWLVVEHISQERRGGAGRVIERETGQVMRFPSFIPPGRIVNDYDSVAEHGRTDDRWRPSP